MIRFCGACASVGNLLSKHHATSSSLVEANEFDRDFLADFVGGFINDDHSAVWKMSDALVWIATLAGDFNGHGVAGKIFGTQNTGELIDV